MAGRNGIVRADRNGVVRAGLPVGGLSPQLDPAALVDAMRTNPAFVDLMRAEVRRYLAEDLAAVLPPGALPQRMVKFPLVDAAKPNEAGYQDGDLAVLDASPPALARFRQSRREGQRWERLTATVPVVTALPTRPADGEMVRYRYASGQVPWLCVWDPALNGGAGAWAVVGGPPMQSVAPGGGSNNIPNTGTHHVVGTPVLTVPHNGRYRLAMSLPLQSASAGLRDLFVGLHKISAPPASVPALVGWCDYTVAVAQYQHLSVAAPFQETSLLAGDAIRMVLSSSTGGVFNAPSITKIIDLHPIELRP